VPGGPWGVRASVQVDSGAAGLFSLQVLEGP